MSNEDLERAVDGVLLDMYGTAGDGTATEALITAIEPVIRADERQKVLAEIQQHVHIAGTRQFALFYLENRIRDMAASTDSNGDSDGDVE